MNLAPPRYVVLEKPVGQTPLEAIASWKSAHPAYANLPATYAGRLDPMASGKLLILLGEECKRRGKYLGLDKEYEIEVVLGVSTDTGDALGLARLAADRTRHAQPAPSAIRTALRTLIGTHTLPYPAFSSKTVAGKPLFTHALEGTLDEIAVPVHEETVYRISLLGSEEISAEELRERIGATLRTVPRSDEPSKGIGADFRQDAVRAQWNDLFTETGERNFYVLTLRVTCGSGTYMRTLAERLGLALAMTAFSLSIHRTKIGRYVPLGPFGFWRNSWK